MFEKEKFILKNHQAYATVLFVLTALVVLIFFVRIFAVPDGPFVYKDLVVVTAPLENALIASPVEITGDARGYWFFEAGFPILILDENKLIVGEGFASADAPWMTEDFVPFTAEVKYETTSTEGYIRIVRNNVSDMPENDDSFDIPIRFVKK